MMIKYIEDQVNMILNSGCGKAAEADAFLRNDSVVKELYKYVKETYKGKTVICCGQFGDSVKRVFKDFDVIDPKDGMDYSMIDIKDCIFVDDCIYSGGNFREVSGIIKNNEGNIISIYVFYKDEDIYIDLPPIYTLINIKRQVVMPKKVNL